MPCRPSFVAVSLECLCEFLILLKIFLIMERNAPQFLYRAAVAARGWEGRGSAGSPLVTMTPGHPRPDPQAPGNHITAGSCSQNWIEEFKMFFFPKLPGSEGWGGEGAWGGGGGRAMLSSRKTSSSFLVKRERPPKLLFFGF